MSKKWAIAILILVGIAIIAYGLTEKPHEYFSIHCVLCHVDEKNDPMNLKPSITQACAACHRNLEEVQSHPTDINPTLAIPEDMLLINGKLTCITCHYGHPQKKQQFIENKFYLRRMVRGPFFCNICHELDEKGHIVFSDVHTGRYKVTDFKTRIDKMSIECIGCHDKYLNDPGDIVGAGMWEHSNKNSHVIGISYENISSKKRREFRAPGLLRKEMLLFDGKIGCGTCHSIYSKSRGMLVMDNNGSALCVECHIK